MWFISHPVFSFLLSCVLSLLYLSQGLFMIPDICYLFFFGRNEVSCILYDLWQKGILCFLLGWFLKSFSYPSSLVLSRSFCFPSKPQNKVSWCLKCLSELIEHIIIGPLQINLSLHMWQLANLFTSCFPLEFLKCLLHYVSHFDSLCIM